MLGQMMASLWDIRRSCGDFDLVPNRFLGYLVTNCLIRQQLVQVGRALALIGLILFAWIAILIFSELHGLDLSNSPSI